jgi:hypothetical protein
VLRRREVDPGGTGAGTRRGRRRPSRRARRCAALGTTSRAVCGRGGRGCPRPARPSPAGPA